MNRNMNKQMYPSSVIALGNLQASDASSREEMRRTMIDVGYRLTSTNHCRKAIREASKEP
jgi:hypothetical protein